MIHIRDTLIGVCMAAASVGVFAQSADEHKGHHPESAATPVTPAVAAKKAPARSMGAEKMAAMDQHMKDMHAMREKMASAKTPEERQALMSEHMKMMQDGIAMMKHMGGMSKMADMQGGKGMDAGMSERQQMMEKRMDMMESMMQMMVDRMQAIQPTDR